MKLKWIFGVGIACMILASVYFVIQLDLNMAVLSMIGLFTLTNAMRAKSFHDQGMARESKWMRWLSILFGISFVVFLIIIIAII